MKSEYTSNRKVAVTPAIPIAVDDPRLDPYEEARTKKSIGAAIDYIGLNGKSLTTGGTTFFAPTGGASLGAVASGANFSPPSNNQPSVDLGFGQLTPTDPTSVTAVWSGNDLVVSFDWDYSNPLNATVSNFIIEMVVDGVTKRTPLEMFTPNRTQTSQTLTLTEALNIKTFNIFTTAITSISVLAIDPFYNTSSTVAASSVPVYAFTLSPPVITVSPIVSGYSVAYTVPTDASFGAIEIVESEAGVTYSRVYLGTIAPANIITSNTNSRYVKARFVSKSGTDFTNFCVAQQVQPINPVSVDNTPPNEVSSVTGVWSSDDIIISYTLPVTDPAARVQIQLTAPNNLVGYFYRFPSGTGAQTTTITKKDLFDQFGEHYSSFAGILRSIDSADNRSAGVSFTVTSRPNPLTGITPTFSTVALSNAYSVNFTLPTGATKGTVYAKHTAWSGNPTNSTYLVYSGLSPAVVTDVDYTTVYIKIIYEDDFGNTSNYSAEGTVTPLDPGLITSFENPISFGVDAVIYAGNSPTTGTRTLFKTGGIFAYDATNSSPSTQIVSNASAGTPTFITTQAQIADWNITSTKIENTLSGAPTRYVGLSATGAYSFWAGSSTTGGNSSASFYVTPTGQLQTKNINIVGSGSKSVTATISGTTATYTSSTDHGFMVGQKVKIINMSPTGYNTTSTIATVPSTTTFTITGITVTGSGTGGSASTSLLSSSGLFDVFNDGSMTATSADITGKITASSGSFSGNISIGASGSLYSGTLSGNNLSGAGFILNTSGLTFSSSGVSGVTTINGTTGLLTTSSANIGGWSVDLNRIFKASAASRGNLSFDSDKGYIYVSDATTPTYTAGINSASTLDSVAFWAGTATQIINSAVYPDPSKQTSGVYNNAFVVRMDGKLYAKEAVISGNITATGGYIGSSDNHWTISSSGIESSGAAIIDLKSGQIQIGNYTIQSLNETELIIADSTLSQNLLYTDFKRYDTTTGTESPSGTKYIYRLSLGSDGRQVEVAKNAEISGTYTGSAQDYRSGGLRNMFTITESQFALYPTAFPDAKSGSVLLVYT